MQRYQTLRTSQHGKESQNDFEFSINPQTESQASSSILCGISERKLLRETSIRTPV